MNPRPRPGDAPEPASRSALATGTAPVALAARSKLKQAGRPDRALIGETSSHGDGPPDRSGRGQAAECPSEVPARGRLDVGRRVFPSVGEDRILSVSAGVTFYALQALFPALAALVSIYGLFTGPTAIEEHVGLASGMLPGGAVDIFRDQIRRIASSGETSLDVAFLAGLGFSLWSANQGMKRCSMP